VTRDVLTAPAAPAAGPATEPVLLLERVTKRFGDVLALDGVSLEVPRGELLAVLGPSGCGKSTMLRSVAGLTAIDGGRIVVEGREVAAPGAFVPPEQRQVGVVFQDLALFPHLSVRDNTAFGLPRRGPRHRSRVEEVLELVGIAALADRYPHELSGGEQQRVALARALAPGPSVVLFDEPFSHLDRNLRTEVREHTVAVLRADGATGVLVTHDQEEALAVGDRVAVLRSGRLEQVADPQTAFHTPATRFVATFLGEADFVRGERDGLEVETVFGRLPVTEAGSGACDVMLRPHEVGVEADDAGPAVVSHTEFRGATVLHHLAFDDGTTLRGLRPHSTPLPVGTRARAVPLIDHPLAVFPR
jgi:iron(III) transport system ATP-binding protein